jgi:hypothetical protein
VLRRIRAGIAPVLCLMSACVSYVTTSAPSQGDRVRIRLTDAGSVQLSSMIGARAESISGSIVEKQDTAWVLSVNQVERRSGSFEPWKGERVVIPTNAGLPPEKKKLSVVRTSFLIGGIVAGLGAILAAGGFEALTGGSGGGGPGGGK